MPATLTALTASSTKEPRVVELCRGSAHARRFQSVAKLPRQPRR